jgi:hypothetical protein
LNCRSEKPQGTERFQEELGPMLTHYWENHVDIPTQEKLIKLEGCRIMLIRIKRKQTVSFCLVAKYILL